LDVLRLEPNLWSGLLTAVWEGANGLSIV